MYKFFFFLILAINTLSSCISGDSKEKFIKNFTSFVTDVDTSAQRYSTSDWEIADEQFADYKDKQLSKWEDLLSPSEKNTVNDMIGKYRALQIKKEVKKVESQIKNVVDQTKSIYNDLSKDTTLTK